MKPTFRVKVQAFDIQVDERFLTWKYYYRLK